jgi:hypothetical protein
MARGIACRKKLVDAFRACDIEPVWFIGCYHENFKL